MRENLEIADYAGYHGVEKAAAYFQCSERTVYRALAAVGRKAHQPTHRNHAKRCKALGKVKDTLRKTSGALDGIAQFSRPEAARAVLLDTQIQIVRAIRTLEAEIEHFEQLTA